MGHVIDERVGDEGRVTMRVSTVPGQPGVHRVDTWLYPAWLDPSGGQPADDDGEDRFPVLDEPTTDCNPEVHEPYGFRWAQPYTAITNRHADLLNAGGQAWNLETSGTPFGQVVAGERGEPLTMDGENRIVFDDFGPTDWLAYAQFWYTLVDGEPFLAIESDQAYNTAKDLTADPSTEGFDIQGLATHEMGHSLGLGHAQLGRCLTMYPYMSPSESVDARTPGDGDVIGIRSLYGPLPVSPPSP